MAKKLAERYCDRCEIDIEPGDDYESSYNGRNKPELMTCMDCAEAAFDRYQEWVNG